MEEKVEIVDEKDRVIKIVSYQERGEKALLARSSFVVVITSNGRIYLPKRSKNIKFFPGCYETGASGAKKIGESLEECAIRELEEELGIKNQKIKFLFEYRHRSEKDNYNAMIYMCVYDGPLTLQKDEVEKGLFVPLTELKNFLRNNEFAPGRKEILKKLLKINTLPPYKESGSFLFKFLLIPT